MTSLFISRCVEKYINMCLVLSCQEWIKNEEFFFNVEIENPVLTEYIELQHMDPDSRKTGIVESAVQSTILHEVDSVGEWWRLLYRIVFFA